MSEMEDYLGRVQAIVWRAGEYVSAEGIAEVQRLVNHGEPAEGMCSLAWAIVREDVRIPIDLVRGIREHARGLVDDEFMPENLEAHTLEVSDGPSGNDPATIKDGGRSLTVVVGREVFVFDTDERDAPQSLGVRVFVDGVSRWSSKEPGWLGLAIGVGDVFVYWWSARRHMALERAEASVVQVIDTDEDILRVFKSDSSWILVCETSVRLHTGGQVASRVELPGVVRDATWDGGVLVVRNDRGGTVSLLASDGELRVIS